MKNQYPFLLSLLLLEHKPKILKRKHKIVLLATFLFCGSLLAEDKTFKHRDKVVEIMHSYMKNVDQKNVEGMADFFTFPFDLHFGSSAVTTVESEMDFNYIFNDWMNSERAHFSSTFIRKIDVYQTGLKLFSNFQVVADIVYDRIDKNGNIIRTERALFHLLRGKGYYGKKGMHKFLWEYLTRWGRQWKIYLISNIELEHKF